MLNVLCLFFLISCAGVSQKANDASAEFKKICIEGSGKGRIELLNTKHTFSYESKMDRPANKFDLVLDFPVVGETPIEISLDPEIMNRTIKNSEIAQMLDQELGARTDKKRITKTIEEFFVFASDFMRFKAAGVYPKHFLSTFNDGHFILERSTSSYIFKIDSFSPNQNFYERVVFKIFTKGLSTDAILTLLLVPESCDI